MADLRQQILDADDIKEELVKVPEWDCKVMVKGLTGMERSKVLNSALTKSGNFDFSKVYPDLVIASAYDSESGEKIFKQTDRDALNNKSGSALERIAGVAVRLSGLGEMDLDYAVKN